MKFYTELTLISNTGKNLYILWSKLYMQLHLAMVELKNDKDQCFIGVSFPEYNFVKKDKKIFSTLGSKLRLFAQDKAALQALNLVNWLGQLTDHVHIKSIQPIPKHTGLITVSRYRPKLDTEKLIRRYARRKGMTDLNQTKAVQAAEFAKRHGLSEEQAFGYFVKSTEKYKTVPFIKIKSLHGGHDFSLMIEQKAAHQVQEGYFNTYGLSSTTTVPSW